MRLKADHERRRRLRLVVRSATGLVAADSNGSSDPFAVVGVAGAEEKAGSVRTRVIPKTLDPEWNEALILTLPPMNREPLVVQVFDHDLLGANDFLGEVCVPLSALELGEVVDDVFDLQPRTHKADEVSGSIALQLSLESADGVRQNKVAEHVAGPGLGLVLGSSRRHKVVVSKCVPRRAAAKCGKIQRGDVVVQVRRINAAGGGLL